MKTNHTVHLGGRMHCQPQDLEILKADVNYTLVYFKDGSKRIVATTLGKILSRLETYSFARINRSLVVNLDCVSVNKSTDSVYNQNIGVISISRRRKEDFYKKMMV